MLQQFFGTEPDFWVRLAVSLVVIIALLGLTAFIIRRMGRKSSVPAMPRPRTGRARLSVVDAVPVDQDRRLVLVRRDDTEHLLLTGGVSDVVVELNIPVRGESPATVQEALTPHAAEQVGLRREPSPAVAPPPEQPSLPGRAEKALEPPPLSLTADDIRPENRTAPEPPARHRAGSRTDDSLIPPIQHTRPNPYAAAPVIAPVAAAAERLTSEDVRPRMLSTAEFPAEPPAQDRQDEGEELPPATHADAQSSANRNEPDHRPDLLISEDDLLDSGELIETGPDDETDKAEDSKASKARPEEDEAARAAEAAKREAQALEDMLAAELEAEREAEEAARREAEALAAIEAERIANEERAEAERLALEAAEREAAERAAAEAAELEALERAEAERAEAERAEAERAAIEAAEREAAELARAEEERRALEEARLEAEARAEEERLAREAAEREEAERLALEAAEREAAERAAAEAAELEARERAEAERTEAERAEAERLAMEAVMEAARKEAEERAEAERLAREAAAREEAERREAERLAALEREEAERLAALDAAQAQDLDERIAAEMAQALQDLEFEQSTLAQPAPDTAPPSPHAEGDQDPQTDHSQHITLSDLLDDLENTTPRTMDAQPPVQEAPAVELDAPIRPMAEEPRTSRFGSVFGRGGSSYGRPRIEAAPRPPASVQHPPMRPDPYARPRPLAGGAMREPSVPMLGAARPELGAPEAGRELPPAAPRLRPPAPMTSRRPELLPPTPAEERVVPERVAPPVVKPVKHDPATDFLEDFESEIANLLGRTPDSKP
ncbi:FliO/MopB family protein [Xanthobacter sp. TB0136]|uniref:FliO/MopB family protein n=1 Tax=Xanthobacter sp. TB0136 TaxID=3459177 RepID=UPI004039C13F